LIERVTYSTVKANQQHVHKFGTLRLISKEDSQYTQLCISHTRSQLQCWCCRQL